MPREPQTDPGSFQNQAGNPPAWWRGLLWGRQTDYYGNISNTAFRAHWGVWSGGFLRKSWFVMDDKRMRWTNRLTWALQRGLAAFTGGNFQRKAGTWRIKLPLPQERRYLPEYHMKVVILFRCSGIAAAILKLLFSTSRGDNRPNSHSTMKPEMPLPESWRAAVNDLEIHSSCLGILNKSLRTFAGQWTWDKEITKESQTRS